MSSLKESLLLVLSTDSSYYADEHIEASFLVALDDAFPDIIFRDRSGSLVGMKGSRIEFRPYDVI